MSGDAIFQAFDVPDLAPPERLLLLWIAKRSKDLECWPSQKTLAADTGLSVRTIARALVVLEGRGIISRRGSVRKGGTRSTDVIRLEYVKPADKKAKPSAKPSNSIGHNGRLIGHDGSAKVTPCPVQSVTVAERNYTMNKNIEDARAREPYGGARRPLPKVDPEKQAAGKEALRALELSRGLLKTMPKELAR